jgi:hypothetical protein
MLLPEGEKGLLAGAVRTGDSIEVDLNSALDWATLGDGFGQTFCPSRNQLPYEDNLGSIPEIEHSRS